MTKKVILNPPDAKLKATASRSTSNNFVVIHIGAIINKVIANPIANSDDKNSTNLFGSLFFSSGIAMSADHCNVCIPIFIASNKPAIPLKTGLAQNFDFSVTEIKSCLSTCIFPFGSRTAVAYDPGTRIITPSITA